MSLFAQLNDANVVVNIIVIPDEIVENGGEAAGAEYCRDFADARWLLTSHDGGSRVNCAAIGGTYDPDRDVFIPPQPFPSWTLNETILQWSAPVARPEGRCFWLEDEQRWVEVPLTAPDAMH